MTDNRNSSSGLYEHFAPQVYAWAYRLLGRHHDAMDVVQDVFIRWTSQCARRRPDRPAGWLRRVTLNRAVDVARKRRDAADVASVEPEAAISTATFDGSDREVFRADVSRALHQLPEMQRAVLVAKVYDDLTFAQVSEELSISSSTAKTHYLRAVTALRDLLRDRWLKEVQP
jgi:RNA polymerase sigma-70 factor (ECF subfamily)